MKLNQIIYIGLILLSLFFYFNPQQSNLPKNTIKTDTIVKTVTLPQITDTIYLTKYKTKVLRRFILDSSLVDSISILNALIDAKTIREYSKKHKDSLITISMFSEVEGKLLKTRIEYDLKPRKVKVIETHTEEKKYAKHSLFYGGGVSSSTQFDKTSLNLNLSYMNYKGNIIEIGVNTNKQVLFGFKKRLFVKY